jgi:hypothetical protein
MRKPAATVAAIACVCAAPAAHAASRTYCPAQEYVSGNSTTDVIAVGADCATAQVVAGTGETIFYDTARRWMQAGRAEVGRLLGEPAACGDELDDAHIGA